MPKKQPRNGFYYFMKAFREQQRKKGIVYNNLKETADAAGPYWTELAKSEKERYTALAKQESAKNNEANQKFTSMGESFAEIDRREREKREAEERETQDIRNIVVSKAFAHSLKQEDFFIMDVNYYCCTSQGEYVVCECTLLTFNLQDGIKDVYHEIINPGRIPIGYTSDAKESSIYLSIPLPDENEPITDMTKILANIVSLLKKHEKEKTLAPIFTMPDKVPAIMNFIDRMCDTIASNDLFFRVYKLPTLFFHLKKTLATNETEVYPTESLALAALQRDLYQTSPGIACTYHDQADRSTVCCMSRAKRWVYTIFDECCESANIAMIPGKHLPDDTDVEAIVLFKEQNEKKRNAANQNPVRPHKEATVPELKVHTLQSLRRPETQRRHQLVYAPDLTDEQIWNVNDRSTRSIGRARVAHSTKPDNYSLASASGPGRGHLNEPLAMSETNFPALSARGRGLRQSRLSANLQNLNLDE